jgi:hypothetical protein
VDSNCGTNDGFGQVLVAGNVSEHASALRKDQAVYVRSEISAFIVGEQIAQAICAMRQRVPRCNFCVRLEKEKLSSLLPSLFSFPVSTQ